MKQIFTETSEPITNIVVKWYHYEDDKVVTREIAAKTITTAHYDANMRVLVVDQSCELDAPYLMSSLLWELPPRRTLETFDLAGPATRRAIELADEYMDRLSKTVFDDDRSDEEIRSLETELNPYRMAF
jgi:hypothetical protein